MKLITCFFTLLLISSTAKGNEEKAQLVLSSEEQIKNLKLTNLNPPILSKTIGEEVKTFVEITGEYSRPDWALIHETKVLKPKDGIFTLLIPCPKEAVTIKLMAIGPMGDIETENIGVYVEKIEEIKKEAEQTPPKRFFAVPSAGLSYTTYQESCTGLKPVSFSGIALSLKGSMNYLLFPPKWDVGLATYFTVLPLFSSATASARFFGFNLRVGYILPQIKEPWRVSLMAGAYYTTMFVSPKLFGFKNMNGPQVFPTARYKRKNDSTISGYFKFSPVSKSFTNIGFSSHEIAVGGAYGFLLKSNRALSLSLDLSRLVLDLPKYNSYQMSTTSITVGAGLLY